MSRVDLNGVNYIGADVVQELVEQNIRRFGKRMRFLRLNLIADELPQVDLVLCRDCVVHFSSGDTFKALRNICRSKSTYLLTTTFASHGSNEDIPTGLWRPLNLEALPFCLPKPLQIIKEECPLDGGKHSDKSLGLWRIEDVEKAVTKRHGWPLVSANSPAPVEARPPVAADHELEEERDAVLCDREVAELVDDQE
jgi:hypothetical protein